MQTAGFCFLYRMLLHLRRHHFHDLVQRVQLDAQVVRQAQHHVHQHAVVLVLQRDLALMHAVLIVAGGGVHGEAVLPQLEGVDLGDELLIPDSALRDGEEVFLDDITVSQLSQKLVTAVTPCVADGYELLEKFLGGEW